MRGVCKTTLARTLNNELLREVVTQAFALVIWVAVSKEFGVSRLQEQIAKRLGMQIEMDQTVVEVGKDIYKRLEKVSFLLILYNVWKPIDLDILGIPTMLG